MLNWIQEIFRRPSQPKRRRPKSTVKLGLEDLEGRIVPSTSLPMVTVASPPAATVTSQTVSAMDQGAHLIATLQQDVSNARQMIDRAIAQQAAYVWQQWEHVVDNIFHIQSPALGSAAPQPGSGSGSGSGATMTAHNPPNQQLKTVTQQAGSGVGSGAVTTVHENASTKRVRSLAGSGSGSGSATVSGEVWMDSDGDGLMDNGESGLQGISVYLDDQYGNQLMSTTTDANGNYSFNVNSSLLNQGSGSGSGSGSGFEIQVVIPPGDAATIENASGSGINSNIDANGYSDLFSLGSGGNQQVNAGLISSSGSGSGTVSGEVWLDSDGDGILDNGETGLQGISINLDDPMGQVLMTTTTDQYGNYQFSVNPSLGSQFEIQVVIPDGYSATIPFASSSGISSSIDASGYSNVFNLPAGGSVGNIDAGLANGTGPLASLSGEVWLDSNDNGTLDSGESGLQAINVNLIDNNGNVVDSTSTDANGDYSFFGLTPNSPYTVQFIAPNGYVFSPQNVGPPATSSSAGVDGSTDPITLTPGQNDSTVNAGLYGSAPIVYQTDVSMLAENQIYDDIDFTADGYDPDGEPLTPVIVQNPTYGSLVYNSSTGLYDYTANSGYTGLDNFQFQLSDGHAVSDVVSVQVLAYSGTIPLGTYDNFPLLIQNLFNGNGGQPSQSSIPQGYIKACWFVADAAGVAQQNPNQIVNLIQDNGNGTYTVTFPGHREVTTGFVGDTNIYSTANGDWLKVLEKAYGTMVWNEQGGPTNQTPYNFINRGNSLSDCPISRVKQPFYNGTRPRCPWVAVD